MAGTGQAPTRKREATQNAILDATSELIAEKGVDGFTLSEVAKRGKINRALIYHYFQNRETLIFRAIRHIVYRYEEAERPGGSDAAEQATRMHIEHPELGRFFFQLLLTDQEIPNLSKRIYAAIEGLDRIKKERGANADFDPAMAVITGWLAMLSWSFARGEMARLLGMDLRDADDRFIAQMRRAGELNVRALEGSIS